MGYCGHISSRQAMNDVASQDPGADRAYPILKALEWSEWTPGPIPGQGGKQAGQTAGEILPTHGLP
jgi:hypothetical protein